METTTSVKINGIVTGGYKMDITGKLECICVNNIDDWSSPTLPGVFYVDDEGRAVLTDSLSYLVKAVQSWGNEELSDRGREELDTLPELLVDVFEDGLFVGEFYVVDPYYFNGFSDVFEAAGLCDEEWWNGYAEM